MAIFSEVWRCGCTAWLGLLAVPHALSAPATAQVVTPRYTSVAGGESQVFSARFRDGAGHPAAGEGVRFSNDACGVFQNGQAVIDTVTDANGVASATFTASNPPGITCWVNASSGPVRAVFDVLTYRPGGAYLTTTVGSASVGQPYTVAVTPKFGVYPLANVDVTARILPGTGSATVAPAARNSGDRGTASFTVTPDASFGSYTVQLEFRGHTLDIDVDAVESPWQDMWWAGPEENGWGMSVVQHGDRLFGVVFAYDDEGRPTWWVMPGGSWNAARTVFSGALYSPRGSPFHAYDTSRFKVGSPVGSASLTFEGAGRVALDYSVGAAAGRKSLTRQPFGPVDISVPEGVGDMWWGGTEQNGWGISVLQQYRTLFMVWFTYDAEGRPTWYVMPQGSWMDASTYDGRIYRAEGSPWAGRVYDATRFRTVDVGSYRLRLTGPSAATLAYSIEGRSGMLELARQPF
jgi:hypothetical protein